MLTAHHDSEKPQYRYSTPASPLQLPSPAETDADVSFETGIKTASRKRKREQLMCSARRRAIGPELIRKAIADHLPVLNRLQSVSQYHSMNPKSSRVSQVTCFYASVAQKSYGSEKRFMCPPPVCRIDGVLGRLAEKGIQARMGILGENADDEDIIEKEAVSFDENKSVSFKQLHISNSAIGQSKTFTMRLSLGPICEFDRETTTEHETSPISIISKPSKKATHSTGVSRKATATRFTRSIITSGSTISLYNRINSQTCRTKYLCVEQGRMTVKSEIWTPFVIKSLDEQNIALPEGAEIRYGSRIILCDPNTGFISEQMLVRFAEKGQIIEPAEGHILQMHKLVLQRDSVINSSELPLSPTGTCLKEGIEGTGKTAFVLLSANDAQKRPKKLEGRQEADQSTSWAPIASDASGMCSVADHVCWTIVGIGTFERTFLDLRSEPSFYLINASADSDSVRDEGLRRRLVVRETIPALLSRPQVNQVQSTISITVRDLCDSEIWMGRAGPLRVISSIADELYPKDVTVTVSLPKYDEVADTNAPLLFVRDGVVICAGCQVRISRA